VKTVLPSFSAVAFTSDFDKIGANGSLFALSWCTSFSSAGVALLQLKNCFLQSLKSFRVRLTGGIRAADRQTN